MDLFLDARESADLLKIIDRVVDLDEGEREDLAKLLEMGRLDIDTDEER